VLPSLLLLMLSGLWCWARWHRSGSLAPDPMHKWARQTREAPSSARHFRWRARWMDMFTSAQVRVSLTQRNWSDGVRHSHQERRTMNRPPRIVNFLGLLVAATIAGIITLAAMGPRVTAPPSANPPAVSGSPASTTTSTPSPIPTTSSTLAPLPNSRPTASTDGRGTPHNHRDKGDHD
jgi:hypothetical protein